ncbi:MAG: hypothetical protein RL217_1808 [Pseudomonadota bacterium]|jgi:Spx/MgsR family transcriptional regulator
MAITLYGIKQCDTMKKTQVFLDQQHLAYQFHDYKKAGLSPELLAHFVAALGVEALLNKKGTTWRALPEELKNNLTPAVAQQALLAYPSMIKRPLLEVDGQLLVGFDAVVAYFSKA